MFMAVRLSVLRKYIKVTIPRTMGDHRVLFLSLTLSLALENDEGNISCGSSCLKDASKL